jgi:hypothetical protein
MMSSDVVSVVVALVVGMLLGAAVLDLAVRYRHGKNYSKWIKQDFDLQWRAMQSVGLVRAFSPFSETIQRISPQFCVIYEEATVSENAPLLQVAGLAYGKALEFLIKDLAKSQNPGREAEIETTALARCVQDYIRDELVRNCAELATWLRNDQMHYVRRHEKHGIEELKKLITLIVALIEEGERRRHFSDTAGRLREEMTT